MKKPTMQDIADHCGVSRITVWKVLNNHSGVSEALRRQVLNAAKTLNYPLPDMFFIPDNAFASASTEVPMTISVIVSRPDSSIFWSNIIHRIAKELTKFHYNLMYTYVPSVMPENYQLPPQLTNGSVQGIIVLNVYDFNLFGLLNKLPMPKVFLDTVSTFSLESLTGDLLLLEGQSVVRQITESFILQGYTRIGFIGDVDYALTNKLRYNGFLQALKEHHIKLDHQYCKTDTIGIETYKEEIFSYLSSLESLPQVFVCASDFVAYQVYQYLLQNHFPVPGSLLLSGYDNTPDLSDLKDWLTTVNVNTQQLGKRLVNQLLYRLQNPDAALEVVLLKSEILYRNGER